MIIIDGDATTTGAHGCRPDERTIEELLDAGAIVIDNTSFFKTRKLRKFIDFFFYNQKY